MQTQESRNEQIYHSNQEFNRERSPRRSDNSAFRDRHNDRRDFRDSRDSSSAAPFHAKSNRNYTNSIFVGGVPYDCDSFALKRHFSEIGNVIRADIVTQQGRHRGMGTVEFSSREEVDRAISKFDHTQLMGREIFVRQDNPPPPQSSSRSAPPGRERFDRSGRDFGRDRYDRGGRDSGRDRYDRGGRDFGRDRYPPRRDDRDPSRRDGPTYEVFVGNLPFSVNWQRLKDIFKEVAEVERADVKLDDRGKSRGFGVVSFRSYEGVLAAVERLNQTEVDGRIIDVREGKNNSAPGQQVSTSSLYVPSKPQNNEAASSDAFVDLFGPDGEQNTTVYVQNLPAATSDEDLIELFGAVGSVIKAEIKRTSDEALNGAVEFSSEDDANAAIGTLNNYSYGGYSLSITFARKL